jgi:hypothetical protein
MNPTITIKKDEETGDVYLDIDDFKDIFDDHTLIEYYEIEESDDGGFNITFYDKDENILHPRIK